ncbi:ankyrin-1-like [Littorina saxatilis]|uniref:SOCS box domain-containing protein n=1 Tax=Littorina saxatilis TaxID=31220 RepID=A0AAN9G093_9CAEN
MSGQVKETSGEDAIHSSSPASGGETGEKTQEEGVTAVHAASSKGNLEVLQLLLDGGCSINERTRSELSPLHCAAGCGHAHIVRHLVVAGASVNMVDSGGRTPVFTAAENGYLDCVIALTQAFADTTIKSNKGLTPLCVAVLNDYTDIAVMLLSYGPQCVNVCDGGNSLPLHYAVRNGNAQLVTALFAAGSRKNVLNKNFESPVHHAVVGGNLEVLELLVKAGCDVNLCESMGNVTPLHVAVNMHSDIQLFRPMLHLLLQGGCILNWRAFSTLETPLYRSLGLGKTDMSRELISHGADPNLASPFDITALQRACQKGNVGLVNLLLSCGINWKRERWMSSYDTSCRREVIELIHLWKDSVVSLQALCRIRVRNTIAEKLEWTLDRVVLPQKVRNYILLRDLVDTHLTYTLPLVTIPHEK